MTECAALWTLWPRRVPTAILFALMASTKDYRDRAQGYLRHLEQLKVSL